MHEDIKKSSYTGSNAFGATFKVYKAEGIIYVLKPDMINQFSKKMNAETARRISERGRVLIIGKIGLSDIVYPLEIVASEEPTIGSPYEMHIGLEALQFDVQDLWLYDFETGEVFYKESAFKPRFTDKGDGTVIEDIGGLMWQQQDDNLKKDLVTAKSYCERLVLGGYSDW